MMSRKIAYTTNIATLKRGFIEAVTIFCNQHRNQRAQLLSFKAISNAHIKDFTYYKLL